MKKTFYAKTHGFYEGRGYIDAVDIYDYSIIKDKKIWWGTVHIDFFSDCADDEILQKLKKGEEVHLEINIVKE